MHIVNNKGELPMIEFCTILLILGILVWPLAFVVCVIRALFGIRKTARSMYSGVPDRIVDEELTMDYNDDDTQQEQDNVEEYDELAFCQLFELGDNMCLIVQRVEMCPDETAFIRVLGDDSYTPVYKRKVRRTKGNTRYIVFNSTNYYLDDAKTQPVITYS